MQPIIIPTKIGTTIGMLLEFFNDASGDVWGRFWCEDIFIERGFLFFFVLRVKKGFWLRNVVKKG